MSTRSCREPLFKFEASKANNGLAWSCIMQQKRSEGWNHNLSMTSLTASFLRHVVDRAIEVRAAISCLFCRVKTLIQVLTRAIVHFDKI